MKGRRIRELTSVVQKRFKFPEGSVELYAEKVANRGLCAVAQAESLRYKLLGGLAVRRACYGVLRFVMESGAKGCEVIVSGKLRAQVQRRSPAALCGLEGLAAWPAEESRALACAEGAGAWPRSQQSRICRTCRVMPVSSPPYQSPRPPACLPALPAHLRRMWFMRPALLVLPRSVPRA